MYNIHKHIKYILYTYHYMYIYHYLPFYIYTPSYIYIYVHITNVIIYPLYIVYCIHQIDTICHRSNGISSGDPSRHDFFGAQSAGRRLVARLQGIGSLLRGGHRVKKLSEVQGYAQMSFLSFLFMFFVLTLSDEKDADRC